MGKFAILLTVATMLVNSTAYTEVRKTYYERGQLLAEYNLKDGKLEGIGKSYYESGQLKVEENYKNGIMISKKVR
ncbi:MAG: toxin-antitoxin system YwqK family antitoxin [Planctomycetota bacterium]